MNDQLKAFARKTLIEGLSQLPEDWQSKFKMMYGRRFDGRKCARTVEETNSLPMSDAVNDIPDDKLDWAMQQVENSIRKLKASSEDSK